MIFDKRFNIVLKCWPHFIRLNANANTNMRSAICEAANFNWNIRSSQRSTSSRIKCFENLSFCVPCAFALALTLSFSIFFTLHLDHVIRRKQKKMLAPSVWHTTSFCACVSVTTSLIWFNYFNCFYMNNSTIFPILFVMLVCYWYYFVFVLLYTQHMWNVCDFNHLVCFIFHSFFLWMCFCA